MNAQPRSTEEFDSVEEWDFDSAQIQPPVENPEAVVPVRFNRDELDQVATVARKLGVPLTAFIREAALRCSTPDEAHTQDHAASADHDVSIGDSETIHLHHGIKD